MAKDPNKYDNLLFEILQNEVQLVPFLDVIFNFLYRRTDLYKIQTETNINIGFPDGVAEKIIQQMFCKYYQKTRLNDEMKAQQAALTDPASFLEIGSERKTAKAVRRKTVQPVSNGGQTESVDDSDCYNGARRENYSWSQTITEIDVKVKVPEEVSTGKHVKVEIKPQHLSVSVLDKSDDGGPTWRAVLNGRLSQGIKPEEAIWTLVPKQHVTVSLEKQGECWWECLLEGETKVDTQKLDTTRPIEDFDEDSQAALQEILFNQRQKMEGKPTTQDLKIQTLLKDAWDKEGSPFQGQPFDPSIINVSNSEHFPGIGN